jgi:glycosyltransferase involved in cell wall biosynthesis
VFAYTPGGRDYALIAGVDQKKVTTVMNATDTSLLQVARDSVSEERRTSLIREHNLTIGRTLGYIGGLDSTKRIRFLAQALDSLWLSDPDIKIVVGGKGSDAHFLEQARVRGQAVMLGYASVEDQALIASVSSALLMPGRIGLVAVDALVLGTPILTTAWPYHAPENEYLVETVTRFTSKNDVPSYASLIRSYLNDPSTSPPVNSMHDWDFPTIDAMVENFSSGVLTMLGRHEL